MDQTPPPAPGKPLPTWKRLLLYHLLLRTGSLVAIVGFIIYLIEKKQIGRNGDPALEKFIIGLCTAIVFSLGHFAWLALKKIGQKDHR